jgi:signal transduction histidine kinase
VLGVVSHDLRNPLSAIAMCSKALLDGPTAEPDPTRRELATAINESAAWMSRLIQDLLDVSTIEAGRLSVQCAVEDVRTILDRVVTMFVRLASERGIELSVAVDDDASTIRADGERLIQAIANLVGNAAKFTARGGAIGLRARARGGEIEIHVEDTGSGIAADELPYVFERYWHKARGGSERGSGLGLAIAKGIVEAHGGRIEVRSTVGVGTVFTIILPREGTCA